MSMAFEWDEYKAVANLLKHDVSFSDAVLVFFDPLALLRRIGPPMESNVGR